MKTVMVGAIYNYGWNKIDWWWRSLKLTGFEGEIHILAYDINKFTLDRMKYLGIIVHECKLQAKQVVIARFKDLAILCQTFSHDTYVIFADVGDIVFQRDPEKFLKDYQEYDYLFASEGIRFEDNSWTNKNLKESLPDFYNMLKGSLVYNAGSIAGKAGQLLYLAEKIYNWAMELPYAKNHDQVIMNVLIRQEQSIQENAYFSGATEGWCHCAASSLFPSNLEDLAAYREKKPVIRNGKLYAENGLLTCLFHHYTRDRETTRKVGKWIEREWDEKRFTYSQFAKNGV